MPVPYRRNKLATLFQIVRRIENWPTAVGIRVQRRREGLRLLRFRNGLNVLLRAGTRDWDAVHELLFADGYERAMQWIRDAPTPPRVLDFGGNIGLFSLLTAIQRCDVTVQTFEPGPPNLRLLQMNLLANPRLLDRIQLHADAVGGANGTVKWFFDEKNPAGSTLFGRTGVAFEVRMRAFADILNEMNTDVDLIKIDIEGAEFDLLRHTPAQAWRKVRAVALDLHDDPCRSMTNQQFLNQMKSVGFSVREETMCGHFLCRS